MLWIVQSNLCSEAERDRLVTALAEGGTPHQLVKAIPFSDGPPDVPRDGPTFFYGATNFVNVAWRSRRWSPCAFYDPALFRFDVYLRHYGGVMLNSGASVCTMDEFAALDPGSDAEFFVRPLDDLKCFAGEVIRWGDYAAWLDRISAGGPTITPETQIVVAEPRQDIACEWRMFMVDGRCVAATMYRRHGRLFAERLMPWSSVGKFAEWHAKKWSPARAFVMDVCLTDEGDLRIVELGCINSAGLYEADARAIVDAVNGIRHAA